MINFSGNKIHKDSLIIEETVIDLNKKYKIIRSNGESNENFVEQYFVNDAFENCLANKLIFRKNNPLKLKSYAFRNFIGLKKLVHDGVVDMLSDEQYNFEIANLPNLEEINLPRLRIEYNNRKPIFNNLPKLRKITFGYMYYLIRNVTIFNNLPNLENVYVTDAIYFHYIHYDMYPIAANVNSNAVLNFTNYFYNLKDSLQELINRHKNTLGFKTITFA